jgi:hypothetical protein
MILSNKQRSHLKKNILVLIGRVMVLVLFIGTTIYGIRTGKFPSGPNRSISLEHAAPIYYFILVCAVGGISVFIYGIVRSIRNIHDIRNNKFNTHL